MPRKQAALRVYRAKRHFERTPEPRGGRAAKPKAAKPFGRFPRFVIQKHAATALHYDFRLEAGGVLKSWAVPKGPSLDPENKRLAVQTEDHPLEYADFEGVIPEGEYGAGVVIVWDRGHYANLTRKAGKPVEAAEAIKRGHILIWLEGEKLHGGFSLVRTGAGPRSWILVKARDRWAATNRKPAA